MKLPFWDFLLPLFLLFPAYRVDTMDSYDRDAVHIQQVERKTANLVKIDYSIMLETLYYCPGANLTEENENIQMAFVRCAIKEKCPVTHRANRVGEREFILIRHNGKPVYLKGKNTLTRIFPVSNQ